MSEYQTAAVLFQMLGNKQVLTRVQIEDHPWIADFVKRFPHCFEVHPYMDVLIFWPEGDSPSPVRPK